MKSTTNTSQIKTEFTLKNATSYAGGKVVFDFLEKIKLEAAFRQLDCAKGDALFYRIVGLQGNMGWQYKQHISHISS